MFFGDWAQARQRVERKEQFTAPAVAAGLGRISALCMYVSMIEERGNENKRQLREKVKREREGERLMNFIEENPYLGERERERESEREREAQPHQSKLSEHFSCRFTQKIQ